MHVVFSFCVILSLFALARNEEAAIHLIQWNLKTPSNNVTDFYKETRYVRKDTFSKFTFVCIDRSTRSINLMPCCM